MAVDILLPEGAQARYKAGAGWQCDDPGWLALLRALPEPPAVPYTPSAELAMATQAVRLLGAELLTSPPSVKEDAAPHVF